MNRGTALFVALSCLLLAGCQSSSDDSVPAPPAVETPPPVAESVNQRERVLAAKDELFQQLSARLTQALESGDAVSAISVCKVEAPRIAASVGESNGLRIGRTSHRLRNQENTPPDWAQAMVDQRVDEPQFVDLSDGRYAALLPIKLQPICMTCHGPAEGIAEPVRVALQEHYPEDQATGFKAGDLRGWFWIEVPVD